MSKRDLKQIAEAPETSMMELAALPGRLKEMRKSRKLTQAELAYMARVDQKSISNVERGEAGHVECVTVFRLAKAMNVNMSYLLGEFTYAKRKPAVVEPEWDLVKVPAGSTLRSFVPRTGSDVGVQVPEFPEVTEVRRPRAGFFAHVLSYWR